VLLYFFSSKSTTVSFENTRAVVKSTAEFIFPILVQTIVIVTLAIAIITVILTLFISHKISGPLHRFKKELEIIGEGDLKSDIKLRTNDQMQELADTLNETKKALRERLNELRNHTQELEESISKSVPEQEKKIKKIKDLMSYFKF